MLSYRGYGTRVGRRSVAKLSRVLLVTVMGKLSDAVPKRRRSIEKESWEVRL
ncbi:MAG: hypothetical protein AVDCRST_MAG02-2906 [uncultured Rubrobacteraceae bacterium]|uniref:Uncharacterized protein n=1 Tax=uncultured Rubrobacteraceae bacterium TaxID=349277 RepID=A0A6J4R5C2_9ACTN|nr:MAG: hypothetical protein AVDCRST_MAG02-2906 [uncultured Rubrobacteraceae bacterium]